MCSKHRYLFPPDPNFQLARSIHPPIRFCRYRCSISFYNSHRPFYVLLRFQQFSRLGRNIAAQTEVHCRRGIIDSHPIKYSSLINRRRLIHGSIFFFFFFFKALIVQKARECDLYKRPVSSAKNRRCHEGLRRNQSAGSFIAARDVFFRIPAGGGAFSISRRAIIGVAARR